MDYSKTYLITFSTYGTWLRGDARGWTPRGRDHAPGDVTRPQGAEHGALEAADRVRLAERSFRLSHDQRRLVLATIRETCRHRGWTLLAVYVGREHVHVVVVADRAALRVTGSLKAWATRRLREAGYEPDREKFWARGGHTSVLCGANAVENACQYVDRHGDRGVTGGAG